MRAFHLAGCSAARDAVAGAKHRLVFVDRLLATLVHLRHGTTHDVLACWFSVDRSTITRTVSPGARLRTLSEAVDHLGASGSTRTTSRRPSGRRPS
ncbi:helix-turn-helix domain-containing protein [Streptomyces sirii]|uniref:helix-turn-helix domain-containing protein n=1 Tax=Streptomyces sirii TaxID=3127701 RepID=UPI003D366DFB